MPLGRPQRLGRSGESPLESGSRRNFRAACHSSAAILRQKAATRARPFKWQIVNRESKLLRCNACGLKLLQLLEPVEDDLVLGKTAVGGIVTEHEEFAAVRREVVVVDRTAE
jgi:hypothetical protein